MHLQDLSPVLADARYPSVSLLASVSGGDVRECLRRLAREVGDRLELELPAAAVAPLVASVHETIREVDPDPQARAVAVFVNATVAQWVSLPVAVRDRVVVDETFATRDVVRALVRARRYRVLTLGATVRLYDGVGDRLSSTTAPGFPAAIGEPMPVPAQRRQRRDPADRERRRLRLATRLVDDLLDPALRDDPLPMFVVGSAPRLSTFLRSSRHRRLIVATVAGGTDSPAAVEELVRPLVDTWIRTMEHDALIQLDAGRSRRQLATGIAEVWNLARDGRGDLLVVEEGFEFPAEVDAATGYPVRADDPKAPEVVDDLVDEVIEAVLASRGRVVFVGDGSLAEYDRVALTLRY